MKCASIFLLLISSFYPGLSQNIVENSSFKFLNIPTSSRHNYLGKAAIATPEPQIDIALANPALIEFHTKEKLLATHSFYFTSMYSNVAYSMNNFKYDIPFVVGFNFINYGKQRNIDINGNDYGAFFPYEASAYIAASKTYERYKFGSTIKLAFADYFKAAIAGVAVDLSMLYSDHERELYATLILKNMGGQIYSRNTGSTSSMPFDIQAAFSKKFKHMPLRFTMMIQELYHWNTATYTVENRGYSFWPQDNLYQIENPSVFSSIMSHFVFGGELNFGKGFKLGASYDVKKGMEGSFEQFRGMTGLGLGFGIYSRRYNFGYSFSKITPISVNHQFSLTLNMKEIIKK